ncbi:hypothetical protein XA68_15619 [Ophiocordyceps unilateralis]|uniref:Ubiquitin 3 binding protein But2 C-terminal domain-containing protein n=1 Tax=Ophiocordyceps unilateralis TaxID=268505 RepID=A0A2A9P7Z9_OPHUN|nr:hypothetical protein XA68_15619 [Ophiocordyceps unilateralis]
MIDPSPGCAKLCLMLLVFCSFGYASHATAPPTAASTSVPKATPTTAHIFLPYYSREAWLPLRGSVLSINAKANETAYDIFCPVQTPPPCDLSLDFPFIVTRGSNMIRFHGTLTSTYTANLECKVAESATVATCSGYSSYRSGYTNGLITGPTEISWTSTLTTEVEWGVLTMANKPKATGHHIEVAASKNAAPSTSSMNGLPLLSQSLWMFVGRGAGACEAEAANEADEPESSNANENVERGHARVGRRPWKKMKRIADGGGGAIGSASMSTVPLQGRCLAVPFISLELRFSHGPTKSLELHAGGGDDRFRSGRARIYTRRVDERLPIVPHGGYGHGL